MIIPGVVPILQYGTSCGYHRILVPFAQMGYPIGRQQPITDAELVVFNRLPNIDITGKRYVLDLDDYWHLGTDHYLYNHWTGRQVPEQIESLIKGAAAVTVTNTQLADRVHKMNKNVHIIPNAIAFGQGQFTPAPRYVGGPTRFVFAGGASHRHDLTLIKDHVEHVPFSIGGYNFGVPEWRKIADMFPSAELVGERPLQKYMECYDRADVALAPLVGNEFDICKSNLKILEAGCKGLAVIASKTAPFFNEVDADFVDYAESDQEWRSLILFYKRNPDQAAGRGAELAAHVRKHYDMADANKLRIELYKSLI